MFWSWMFWAWIRKLPCWYFWFNLQIFSVVGVEHLIIWFEFNILYIIPSLSQELTWESDTRNPPLTPPYNPW
jgi:hypothetical protein